MAKIPRPRPKFYNTSSKINRCVICECETTTMYCASCYGKELIGPDYVYTPNKDIISKTLT